MTLLSQYGFNEGSGLVSADSSGNGLNLVASDSSTSWDAAGKNGAGARPTHTGNIDTSSRFLSPCTLMFWLKRTGTWSGSKQFWRGTSPGIDFWIGADSGTSYRLESWQVGGAGLINTTVTLTLDTWFHVAMTCNGTDREFFVDAVSKVTATGQLNGVNFGNDTGVFMGSGVVGIMDELRLFDTVLSQSDIQTWMNTPVGRRPIILRRPLSGLIVR
jgi:hypothetical protein